LRTNPPSIASKQDNPAEDYQYQRNGTCNLFMAFQPLQGGVKVTQRRTSEDFAYWLKLVMNYKQPSPAGAR